MGDFVASFLLRHKIKVDTKNISASIRTLGGFSFYFPVSSCLPWKRTLFWTELPIRGQTGEGTGWVTKQKIAGLNFQNNMLMWYLMRCLPKHLWLYTLYFESWFLFFPHTSICVRRSLKKEIFKNRPYVRFIEGL